MKRVIRVTFCIGLLALICEAQQVSAAISLSGQAGGIDFAGSGTITHMQQPPLFEVFGDPSCTPHSGTDFSRTCQAALDTSLLGNSIVRAEHVRITSFSGVVGFYSVVFGCAGCGNSVFVNTIDIFNGPGGGRLPAAKEAALQSLIDQVGAHTVRMSVSISGGNVTVSSSVRAIGLDIKPGGENSFNPRSRGVIGIAILTTQSFNASSVDVNSLRFGVTGQETPALRAVLDDVDSDGDSDLLVFFRAQDTGINCDTLFTYISGETLTGQAIAGTDSIAVVGCH